MKAVLRLILAIQLVASVSIASDDSVPPSWLEPTKPFRLIGPISYIGTRGLGVYLIRSSAGLALLSGALPPSAALIRDSIRSLGFKLEEVRLLLVSHAHFDHVGTLAELKKMTGAPVVAMEPEAELLRSGGKSDYLFAKRPAFHFTPVSPDRLVKDGEVVTWGELKLTAHWTPGHTKGCTTWETSVEDGGRRYDVVFLDGTSVNPGTRFTKAPSYPGIAADYARTFSLLESLRPDIFLAYHAEAFDLDAKRKRSETEGVKAWVDPAGYRARVAESKAKFEKLVAEEKR